MSGSQQMMMAGSAGRLLLTPQTWTAEYQFAGAGASAYVSFWPDGRVTYTLMPVIGQDIFLINWCSPTSLSNGSVYAIYFAPIAGSGAGGAAPDASNLGPINQWLVLSSVRHIGYNATGPFRMGSWNCSIGRNPSGPALVTHRVNASLWSI